MGNRNMGAGGRIGQLKPLYMGGFCGLFHPVTIEDQSMNNRAKAVLQAQINKEQEIRQRSISRKATKEAAEAASSRLARGLSERH